MAASFIWWKLYVELSYLARRHKPGVLTNTGLMQLQARVDHMLAEDCPLGPLLVAATVLEEKDGVMFCPQFARDNAHLSGDFKRGVDRGARNSAIVRQEQQVAKEAMAQSMLLPPEVFKRQDGTDMTASEIQRAMVLIRTLDGLCKTSRQKRNYTEGLMASACAVIAEHNNNALREFYFWLTNKRDKEGNFPPTIPSTAEQLIDQFKTLYAVSLEGQK
jgi:hypothetical protein